jgi:hypothetical protein
LEPDHEAPIGDLDYEYYYYIEILWHNWLVLVIKESEYCFFPDYDLD